MKVNFDLSRLHEEALEECKKAMATLQPSIPVFAAKLQEWVAEERARRQKVAQGAPAAPVRMWIPLLDEGELERVVATLVRVHEKLENVGLEALVAEDVKLANVYAQEATFYGEILWALACMTRDLRRDADRPVN